MGFMDKFKDAAQQAQHAANAELDGEAARPDAAGAAVDAALGLSGANPLEGTDGELSTRRRRAAGRPARAIPAAVEVESATGARAAPSAHPDRGSSAPRVEIRDPRAYRWALRGSTGLGEGYVDGPVDTRRPRRPVPDRVPQPAAARPPARPLSPAARPGAAARPGSSRATRAPAPPGTSRPTTTSASRLFEAFLDPRLVYSCAVFARRRRQPRGRAAGEARARLRGARPRPGRPPARDRHRLGRARDPRRGDPRLPGDDDDDLPPSARLRARARRGPRGSPTESRSCSPTIATCTGTYDKLVSIEMIEAVGLAVLPRLLRECAALTKPGGAMFLQAIVIADHLYELEKNARTFANKHVFPGGCLPSLGVDRRARRAATGCPSSAPCDISADYARPCALWRAALQRGLA